MLKRSVSAKIAVPVLIVMLVVMGVVLWVTMKNISQTLSNRIKNHMKDVALQAVKMVEENDRSLKLLEETLLDAHKKKIKAITESAFELAKKYYDEYKSGKLTEEEAKKLALSSIDGLRYDGGTGYIFINNSKGAILCHPNKKLIGRSLYNLEDENGVKFMQELIKVSKKGGGFVKYMWPKPGEEKPQPKLSYALYFEPWDWVIGTGVYIDDVKKELQKVSSRLWDDFRKTLFSIKFGESSYPAIIAEDGTVILYIKKEIEGKKVTFKDAKTGENLLPKFLANKNGFVEYYYTKPGQDGVY